MVNGNNIFISLDPTAAPFAATTANEIQTECEKIPISSPNTGEWESHLVGRKSWSFTVSSLITEVEDIRKILMIGKSYTITVYGRNGSTVTPLLQGTATCVRAKASLTRGNIANGSFSFDGNGEFRELITDIKLSPTAFSVVVGNTQQITPTISPDTATHQDVSWESSDTSVATVNASGLVTGVGEGTCTITCTAQDGSGVTATSSCEVTVILVSEIELTSSSISVLVNDISQNPVEAIVSPNDASNKHVSWTSSNPAYLIVTQDGDNYTMQGVVAGTYTLTATATDGSGVSASCYVFVE